MMKNEPGSVVDVAGSEVPAGLEEPLSTVGSAVVVESVCPLVTE